MNCLTCGKDNPATVAYCTECGNKLDLTADEIQASLADKAKRETAGKTEFHAKQLLVFAILLFLVAVTALVVAGGAPEGSYFIPGASKGAEYVKVDYKFRPEIEPLYSPLEKP